MRRPSVECEMTAPCDSYASGVPVTGVRPPREGASVVDSDGAGCGDGVQPSIFPQTLPATMWVRQDDRWAGAKLGAAFLLSPLQRSRSACRPLSSSAHAGPPVRAATRPEVDAVERQAEALPASGCASSITAMRTMVTAGSTNSRAFPLRRLSTESTR